MRRPLTALMLVAGLLAASCSGSAAPTPQIVYVTPKPTATAEPISTKATVTPTPTEQPLPEPTLPPDPTPVPTPEATFVFTEKPLSVGAKTLTLSGVAGEYTWATVNLDWAIYMQVWTVNTKAPSGCSADVVWKSDVDLDYHWKSSKAGTVQGHEDFPNIFSNYFLSIISDCATWKVSLVPKSEYMPTGSTPSRSTAVRPELTAG
jgi:hypothetical protein